MNIHRVTQRGKVKTELATLLNNFKLFDSNLSSAFDQMSQGNENSVRDTLMYLMD